jgi:hypothetical protein
MTTVTKTMILPEIDLLQNKDLRFLSFKPWRLLLFSRGFSIGKLLKKQTKVMKYSSNSRWRDYVFMKRMNSRFWERRLPMKRLLRPEFFIFISHSFCI